MNDNDDKQRYDTYGYEKTRDGNIILKDFVLSFDTYEQAVKYSADKIIELIKEHGKNPKLMKWRDDEVSWNIIGPTLYFSDFRDGLENFEMTFYTVIESIDFLSERDG